MLFFFKALKRPKRISRRELQAREQHVESMEWHTMVEEVPNDVGWSGWR